MRTSLWNSKAGYTAQVRKETLGSTYNHLQVCGHWYSAVASTVSSVCIRNGKNSCRLMHRNGRNSWRWLHQAVGFCHGRTGAADQCPDVKPWVESVHCVEMIAHLEPQETIERKERTGNSAESSNSTRPFRNYRGPLALPALRVGSLIYAVIKQLSCHALVK